MLEGDYVPHDHRALGEPAQVAGGDDVAFLDLLVFHGVRSRSTRVMVLLVWNGARSVEQEAAGAASNQREEGFLLLPRTRKVSLWKTREGRSRYRGDQDRRRV